MYKIVLLCALMVACVYAAPKPGFLAAAPVVAAPVVAAAPAVPVATSYSHTYQASVKSPIIAAAPLLHAPSFYAAPAYHVPAYTTFIH